MKKLFGLFVFGATATLVAAGSSACSSSDTAATSADASSTPEASVQADASTKDSSASDSSVDEPDGATGCNTVTNGAPESTSSTVKGSAPAATGGTIADGTYFQTELNVYDPGGTASAPSPSGLKVTLLIKGNQMYSVQELPDASVDTFAETFTVNGTALDRTLTCPKMTPDLKAVYSVSGSTLTIYETDPKTMIVAGSVYAKQ